MFNGTRAHYLQHLPGRKEKIVDFEQILAFVNVARYKSFSAAAEQMHISQPSVSVRVKALEEELGVLLFDRSRSRETKLTEAGRLFLDYAQNIINLQEECRERLTSYREEESGMVSIGASTVPGVYFLPSFLVEARRILPGLTYAISVIDTGAVIDGVLNYDFELGFVGLQSEDERLAYIPLAPDELVICAPRGYLQPPDKSQGVKLADITGKTLILREKGSATRRFLEKALVENGMKMAEFSSIIYIDSMEATRQAVKEGLGLAVLSRLAVGDLEAEGSVDVYTFRGLDLRRTLYLVYHRSRALDAAALKLRKLLESRLEKR